MTRGTFANVRIKNLMVPGVEGGVTRHQPDGEQMSIYDAAMRYEREGVPLIDLRRPGVRHGQLARLGRQGHAPARRARGRRAELRAHPPLEPRRHGRAAAAVPRRRQRRARSASTARRPSTSTGSAGGLAPRQETPLAIRRADGTVTKVSLRVRIDTPIEIDYYRHGGILPYVLRQLLG